GFVNPTLAMVRDAIAATLDSFGAANWFERIIETVPTPMVGLVQQLAVAPIPEREERDLTAYVREITIALIDRDLLRQSHDMLGRLQRTDPRERESYRAIQADIMALEAERRRLRER